MRPAHLAALTLAALITPAARAQTPAAEVRDAADVLLQRLNTDGAFVLVSPYGSPDVAMFAPGPIPVAGTGGRLMYYAGKHAFRAGYVTGTQWDADSVGKGSVAFGLDNRARGPYSTAFGADNRATGGLATAMGNLTTASGSYATAMGLGATASGTAATAMGQQTTASGFASTATGVHTTASGMHTLAAGFATRAQASASVALGRYNIASGDLDSWVAADPLLVGGDGTSDAARSNSFVILKNGAAQFQGTVTASVASPSDLRLKEDVRALGPVLARVLRLRPVTYRYRVETERSRAVQVGLVAQEVAPLFPELVEAAPDGYLSVAYGNLAPVAVAAIQEQQAEIARQAAEIGALRDRLAALEASVARLGAASVAAPTAVR